MENPVFQASFSDVMGKGWALNYAQLHGRLNMQLGRSCLHDIVGPSEQNMVKALFSSCCRPPSTKLRDHCPLNPYTFNKTNYLMGA